MKTTNTAKKKVSSSSGFDEIPTTTVPKPYTPVKSRIKKSAVDDSDTRESMTIAAWNKHFNVALNSLDVGESSIQRMLELHPSSFPYCGLRHAHQRLTETHTFGQSGALLGSTSAFSEFFMSIGTSVHTVLQEWIGKAAVLRATEKAAIPSRKHHLTSKVIGNWKCRSCNHVHHLTEYRPCSKCSSRMEYQELPVTYGRYIRGQVDCVFLPDGKKSNAWPFDYKTTSVGKINDHNFSGRRLFPFLGNKKQVEAYAFLIQNGYPQLTVRGFGLDYITRDNPSNRAPVAVSLTSESMAQIEAQLKLYDQHFHHVVGLNHRSSKDLWTTLLKLHDERPCRSKQDYVEGQLNEYSPCPLSEQNLCWGKDSACHKFLKEAVRETTVVPVHELLRNYQNSRS